jgi:hypothetical protein
VSDLIIDGIEVLEYASLSIRQTYEEIQPSSLMRLGNGDGLPQTAEWDGPKLRTSIQITGTIPAGLDGINWKGIAGIEISCASARAIQGNSNVITLPAARRSDLSPWAQAIVNGRLVATTFDLVGNVATLATVVGASAYRISYYPRITVHGNPSVDEDATGAAFAWSLDAEEL